MQISIDKEILEKYPEMQIGYLAARVSIKNHAPFTESLKSSLGKHLQDQGINATNFAIHQNIAIWRKIYEQDFLVKAKTYRSSIEALLRRVVTGKGIWNICNVVDLYNCCSVLTLLPMGGYDLNKISGDITIRYAKDEEPFLSLGEKEPIKAKGNHVVYADQKNVICWLWNHKDSSQTCIDETTQYVLFFIDAFDNSTAQNALIQLKGNLIKIDCTPLEEGVLNKESPQANIKGEICS
jgi:lysyl-tRNA synthetase class 2